jgi:hypothetical protein
MVIRPTDRRRESAIAAGHDLRGPYLPPHSRHNATAAVLLGFRESLAATRSATGRATFVALAGAAVAMFGGG